MSNEITIEKIDAVIQRVPSATYAQAKKALMDHNGDVIEAIISLESNKSIENNISKKTKQAKKVVEDIFSKDSEDFKDINIVSVGIRDFCNKEYLYAKSNPRIDSFYD